MISWNGCVHCTYGVFGETFHSVNSGTGHRKCIKVNHKLDVCVCFILSDNYQAVIVFVMVSILWKWDSESFADSCLEQTSERIIYLPSQLSSSQVG